MASSSSTASTSLPLPSLLRPKKYHVFISFRGEDTRTSFTCHLHPALRRRNIATYIDDRLDRGDVISDALMKAIRDSCASLIIFSKNYAFSKWCLDELTAIMECKNLEGQIVIPLFYQIDPSHVRKQFGSYMDAFEKHERDSMIDKDKALKWKAALNEAANIAGYDSQSYRIDYELIEDIVKGVLQKLNHMNPSQLRGLVGVEQNCARMESLLRIHSNEVRIIGIWDMPGIGKTTLTAILFAKLTFHYEGRCFLENVTTKSEKYGLSYLHSMLLYELLREENPHICTPQPVSSIDLSRLKSKKVFIVLDDIRTSEQLDYLIGECDWLGLGSVVIVTTRDKLVVSRGVDEIYEVKELNCKYCFQLFCLNAFNKTNLEMQYKEQSVRAVVRVGGVPLAIKFLSAFLHSKSEEQWDSALRILKKDGGLRDVLRLIYVDLDYHEKYTLLAIAFFLKGLKKNEVIRLLDVRVLHPHIRIRNLVDKALITISNYKTIEIHHLTQEIFQESLEGLAKLSRSLVLEDVYHTMNNNWGTNAVEGTTALGSSNRCNVCLPSSLQDAAFELSYHNWNWSEYLWKSLPSAYYPENLVELHIIDSPSKKLWDEVQNLPNLLIMKVMHCKYLLELPNLSGALNLRGLYLIGCTSLRDVHPSILSLPRLLGLRSDQCSTLKSLRCKASSNSSKSLSVVCCSSLQEFFLTPKKKRRLYLGSTSTDELPPSTSPLEILDYLTFRVTENFDKLDTTLNNLWHIKELDLSHCTLFELPENINKLIFLNSLKLNGSCLVRLPANIKHLSRLRFLKLCKCRLLNSLPQLPPLIHLDARDCTSLETVSHSTSEPLDLISKSAASYLFENCTRLDQDALITIMVDATVRIKQAADNLLEEEGYLDDEDDDDIGQISFCFPGNKCPYWFSYRSARPLLTIRLRSLSEILGFAFSVVLPASKLGVRYNVGCECSFEIDDREIVNLESWFFNDRLISSGESKLISDHIYLWYDALGSAFIMDKLMYCRVNSRKFSFKFFTTPQYNKETEMSPCEVSNEEKVDMKEVMIRSCGVQPIYSLKIEKAFMI